MNATTHPMASADAAWYRMDRPTNHMVISSVLTFDEPLTVGRLRALIRDRMVTPFPRFRQHVVASGPLGTLHWEDDPDFDLDLHLHRRALPAPGDQATLQELVGDLMATSLDPSRALWDTYLIEGYGAGCAVLSRMHHCIADGIALAQVMLMLADSSSAARPVIAPATAAKSRPPAATLTAPARAAAGLGRGVATALVHEGMEMLLHPRHLLGAGREARDDAAALLELLTFPAEHETLLKGRHGPTQRVAWTPPLSLPDVKAVAHATHTTVNDVLLAALSGGLARYLAARGEFNEDLNVMVPFNIRPPSEPLPADLGNRFGLILLALPISAPSAQVRLAEVHRRMLAVKHSRQPAMSYAILGAMGLTPAAVEARVIDLFSAKTTAVVTNVPGPRDTLELAGVPIREVLVWAPCAGSVGMSVSIFSYRDAVSIGFMTHASLVPQPDALAGEVVAELEALGRVPAGTDA